MKSLMQESLGADWERLPPALMAHYRFGTTVERGHLDIAYPRFMQPLLRVLFRLGALVDRPGKQIATVVEKTVVGGRQHWRRRIAYPDGKTLRFDSFWVAAGSGGKGQLIEFVNPLLGLQMAPWVEGDALHYRGVRYVLRLGRFDVPIPECCGLGHATIVERALDAQRFAMDFRLTHPLFGELFRYSGEFEADAG